MNIALEQHDGSATQRMAERLKAAVLESDPTFSGKFSRIFALGWRPCRDIFGDSC
jgi:hypothetical protein